MLRNIVRRARFIPRGGHNANVDAVGEYLAGMLDCPVKVEALYPSAARPQSLLINYAPKAISSKVTSLALFMLPA